MAIANPMKELPRIVKEQDTLAEQPDILIEQLLLRAHYHIMMMRENSTSLQQIHPETLTSNMPAVNNIFTFVQLLQAYSIYHTVR